MNTTIKILSLFTSAVGYAIYGIIVLDCILHHKWNETILLLIPAIGFSLYQKIKHADH